jgi:type IV secretory pathway VirB3-like protein
MNDDELEQRDLYLAWTRPAMTRFVGLPHLVTGLFFTAAGYIMIFGQWPPLEAILVLPYVGARLLLRLDHNIFRLIGLCLRTGAIYLKSFFVWHGISPSPFPLRPREPRGIV